MGKLKKPLLVVAAVIIVAGLSIGGYTLFNKKQSKKQSTDTKATVRDDATNYAEAANNRDTTVATQVKQGTYKYQEDSAGAVLQLARNQANNKQYDDAIKTIAIIPDLTDEKNVALMINKYDASMYVYASAQKQDLYDKTRSSFLAYLQSYKTNSLIKPVLAGFDKAYPKIIPAESTNKFSDDGGP